MKVNDTAHFEDHHPRALFLQRRAQGTGPVGIQVTDPDNTSIQTTACIQAKARQLLEVKWYRDRAGKCQQQQPQTTPATPVHGNLPP
ncbi:hypothetical protein [Microbulbifer taiwanensis]|uniref:hypothetical protein n=1 Tax=Microbulbifer taiwanensis TaxID=986746 RepID=UPI003617A1DC